MVLSDEQVAEIEQRANAASPTYVVDWSKGEHALLQASGWRPTGEEQPRTIATFDKDDGYLDLLFCAEAHVDIPALIRDWRAMRAIQDKYESLKSRIAWHRDGVGPDVPVLQERYDNLMARNAALREQLAEVQRELLQAAINEAEIWKAFLRSSGVAPEGDDSADDWAVLLSSIVSERDHLQSQLAQVTSERDEAKQDAREALALSAQLATGLRR